MAAVSYYRGVCEKIVLLLLPQRLEYQPIEALDASVEASIAHALAQGEERDPPSVSVALAHLQELTPNALVYAMLETLGKAPLLSTDTLMELCTCSYDSHSAINEALDATESDDLSLFLSVVTILSRTVRRASAVGLPDFARRLAKSQYQLEFRDASMAAPFETMIRDADSFALKKHSGVESAAPVEPLDRTPSSTTIAAESMARMVSVDRLRLVRISSNPLLPNRGVSATIVGTAPVGGSAPETAITATVLPSSLSSSSESSQQTLTDSSLAPSLSLPPQQRRSMTHSGSSLSSKPAQATPAASIVAQPEIRDWLEGLEVLPQSARRSTGVQAMSSFDGMLHRKVMWGKWKQFYYIITATTNVEPLLCEFPTEDSMKPTRVVKLRNSTITCSDFLQKRPHSFMVVRRHAESLVLAAANEAEKTAWIHALASHSKIPLFSLDMNMFNVIAVVINESGKILGMSDEAISFFGYRRNKIIGRNVKRLMPAEIAREHDRYLARYVKSEQRKLIGKPRRLLATIKGGREVPVRMCIGEYFDEGMRKFIGTFVLDNEPAVIRRKTTANNTNTDLSSDEMSSLTGRKTDNTATSGTNTATNTAAKDWLASMLLEEEGDDLDELGRDGDSDVHLVGMLSRRKLFGRWSMRHFVIDGPELREYRDSDSTRPLHRYELRNCTVVEAEGLLNKPNTFALARRGKDSVFLQAPTPREFKRWTSAIEKFSLIPAMSVRIEMLNTVSIIANEAGIILGLSPAALAFFGYRQEEVVGKNVKIFMTADIAKHHQSYINAYLRSNNRHLIGRPRRLDVVIKDGSHVQALVCLGEYYEDGKRRFLVNIRADNLDDTLTTTMRQTEDKTESESVDWSSDDEEGGEDADLNDGDGDNADRLERSNKAKNKRKKKSSTAATTTTTTTTTSAADGAPTDASSSSATTLSAAKASTSKTPASQSSPTAQSNDLPAAGAAANGDDDEDSIDWSDDEAEESSKSKSSQATTTTRATATASSSSSSQVASNKPPKKRSGLKGLLGL